MRLDPEHRLAPQTVEAIRDLLGEEETPTVDDDAILRVALGTADAGTRLACARAALRSAEVRERLIRVRSQVRRGIEGLATGEGEGDEALLRAFAGPFAERDAAAVFPTRFGDPERLRRLVAEGRLRPLPDGRLLPPGAEEGASGPPDDAGSPQGGWLLRFCEHYADAARRVDGALAEGRWSDASERLRADLANLRAAWEGADRRGWHELVETMARSLVAALLEAGEEDGLARLIVAAYRAADALGLPRLRSWLLSYEGVASARSGDAERARALWSERARLNREIGNPVAEADALLDIAAQAIADADWDEFRVRMTAAEPVVAAAGRADFDARAWSMRAFERMAADDQDGAVRCAERALATLDGVTGVDSGLFVRFHSAQVLLRCGRLWASADALTGVLERCAESGRSVQAALVLAELAAVAEADGRLDVARRCLLVALGVHREIGTRYAEPVAESLDRLRARAAEARPGTGSPVPSLGRWEAEAEGILRDLGRMRAVSGAR